MKKGYASLAGVRGDNRRTAASSPMLTTVMTACFVTLMALSTGACRSSGPAVGSVEAGGAQSAVEVLASVDPLASSSVIPVDPAVRVGRLDNGLTYYIRHNEKPVDRAELRLVVNAGSILEDESQLGLAHFVEHMAFNGTERFHKQELIDYLELTGVRFGADLNAYTSFDETVYELQVPTDSVALLDTGIQILREWSSRVLFEPEEVEKERGVVIEEWRLDRGADARIRDKELPVMLHGSRYPERLPIGTKENLESFDLSVLTQFYRDWYRPDLMAVVVVGDVDVDRVERLIRSEFSSLRTPAGAPAREQYTIPDHEETLVSIVSDPEAPIKSIAVLYKFDDPDAGKRVHTNEMIRVQFVEGLYSVMLNNRLDELTQTDSPPFFGAGSGFGGFARSKKLYSVSAIPGEAGYEVALEAVLTEIERVRRFGFEPTELARAKENLLRGYQRAFTERDKTESRRYVSEYVNNFLEGEAIPGIEYEYDLAKRLLPEIQVDEVNQVAARSIPDHNRVLLVSGPEIEGEPMPTAANLLAIFDRAKQANVDQYIDVVTGGDLIEALPQRGRIVSEDTDNSVGIHHMVLSNGVNVYFKQTDFKNDQVLISATSPGGSSLVRDELDVAADFASSLIAQGGLGRFGPIELQKKLAGKALQVSPSITERRESIGATSSPDDLETMLQLVYLYFTAPRADSVAFQSYVTRYRSVLENMNVDPSRAFYDTLSTTLVQNHPRRKPLDVATLDKLDLQESFEIFKDRFADAGDFTFFFVGAFDPAQLRPLVEQYVASLPSTGRVEQPRDLGIRPPTGVVEKYVSRGTEPKSQVQIVLTGEAEYTEDNRRLMRLVEGLLDIRLREVLREDLGGTYGVSVSGSLVDEPASQFQFAVGFSCAPDRVDELTRSALAELERFVEEGPSETNMQKVLEKSMRQHEVGLTQNEYWISSMRYYQEKGLSFDEIVVGGKPFYDSVTAEDVRAAAALYLSQQNTVKVVLNPAN